MSEPDYFLSKGIFAFEPEISSISTVGIVVAAVLAALPDKMVTCAELSVLCYLIGVQATQEADLSGATGIAEPLLDEIIWSLLAGGWIRSEDGLVSLSSKGHEILNSLGEKVSVGLSRRFGNI